MFWSDIVNDTISYYPLRKQIAISVADTAITKAIT